MNKRAVLIFGAFNPVTNAHINMGVCAQREYPDADITYVLSGMDYLREWKGLKEGDTLSYSLRYRILRESLKPYGFIASDIECQCVVLNYTYEIAEYFSNQYQEVILCMGADKLCELHKWHRGEELVSSFKFLVIIRNNSLGELDASLKKYECNFTYVDALEYQEVSSTEVRKAYIEGRLEDIKNVVPEYVYQFLSESEEIFYV